MASRLIFLRRNILGLSLFLYAKLSVSIPSYVYFLDGYNQGVDKEALQNNPPLALPAIQSKGGTKIQ